jgi:hypothetical protein
MRYGHIVSDRLRARVRSHGATRVIAAANCTVGEANKQKSGTHALHKFSTSFYCWSGEERKGRDLTREPRTSVGLSSMVLSRQMPLFDSAVVLLAVQIFNAVNGMVVHGAN